jgi:hypothetical protein
VPRRDLGERVEKLLALGAAADDEDRARPVTRTDEDVLRVREAMEEVPGRE